MSLSSLAKYVLLCGALLLTADAAVVNHEATSMVESGRSLWKPRNGVDFGENIFCFMAQDGKCKVDTCAESLLCTFDGGDTVGTLTTNLPFCGDHGVVIKGELHCPSEQKPSKESNTLVYSVNTFSPKGSSLVATISVDKQFVFSFGSDWKLGAVKELIFNGNPVYVTEDEIYVLPLTAMTEDGSKAPVVFHSVDALTWKFVSRLPFTGDISSLHAVRLGRSRIGVVSRSQEGFVRVTSNYLGKWWSDIRRINSTAPPFALNYPSGLTMEYNVGNTTPLSAVYHSEGFPKLGKKTVSLLAPSIAKGAFPPDLSSSYAVAYRAAPARVVVFHDATDSKGEHRLHASRISVDDSEEVKLMKENLEKEVKKRVEEAAARERARQERLERQAKERRDKVRKEQERRKAFNDQDAPNIALAKNNMIVDGEFIVVRSTNKENIELEKSTFFW